MTPTALLQILALTWLSIEVVAFFVALHERTRAGLAAVLLIVYTLWVVGWPVVIR